MKCKHCKFELSSTDFICTNCMKLAEENFSSLMALVKEDKDKSEKLAKETNQFLGEIDSLNNTLESNFIIVLFIGLVFTSFIKRSTDFCHEVNFHEGL